MTPDEVAAATYAAMCALPAYAELGQAIAATVDDDARLELLAGVDDATRSQALRYLASSADPVMRERARRLAWLRADPARIGWIKRYYSQRIADFISNHGMTFDPRNVERGKPALVPFVLFPKQVELVNWILERWQRSEGGLIIKPRDCGISWVMMAVACSLCLLRGENLVIGFGSAKEQKLDQIGESLDAVRQGPHVHARLAARILGLVRSRQEHALHADHFPRLKQRHHRRGRCGWAR